MQSEWSQLPSPWVALGANFKEKGSTNKDEKQTTNKRKFFCEFQRSKIQASSKRMICRRKFEIRKCTEKGERYILKGSGMRALPAR
jgi:hypothetical protein